MLARSVVTIMERLDMADTDVLVITGGAGDAR
jgi:hypothetical protein